MKSKNLIKIVTHKSSSEARQRAHKIIEDIRHDEAILGHYKFFCRPIGSQKRKCIVQDNTGKYDLDFQIVLTKNSKDDDSNPTAIKKAFLKAFTRCQNNNEKVEDSTTVITVRCSKSDEKFNVKSEKFSFDFVIISIDEEKRIRRNGNNQYTWVQLPSKNSYIYERYNSLNYLQQKELMTSDLLPKVIEEKSKDESVRIPTVVLFYNAVNDYYKRNRIE